MNKGFTLIELMILLVIIGIIAALALPAIFAVSGGSNVSFGINGASENRCQYGFVVIIGPDGRAQQLVDDQGRGVRCTN